MNYPKCPFGNEPIRTPSTLEKPVDGTKVIMVFCAYCSALLGIVNKQ